MDILRERSIYIYTANITINVNQIVFNRFGLHTDETFEAYKGPFHFDVRQAKASAGPVIPCDHGKVPKSQQKYHSRYEKTIR